MAPTEYRAIAKRTELRPLPALRHAVAAGEPLNPEIVASWQAEVGVAIHDGYGQTETGALTGMPIGPPVRPGSMGKPLPGFKLWIDDGELCADPSTIPTFFIDGPDDAWRTGDRVSPGRGRLPVVRGPRRRRDHLGRLPDRPVRGRVGARLPPGGGRGRRGRGARRGARPGRARGGRAARRQRADRRAEARAPGPRQGARPRPTSTRASSTSRTRCRRPRAARSSARCCARLSRVASSSAWPNRLAHETSPYLLQHKDNPVDWYPWGDEALARAREEDKPILLSIGYSACHWCHVMERESFEDEQTADADEPPVRAGQARPRGAARPRRDLHGGVPGDDRLGRLAAQRLPDPRAGAVLRGHVLPARAARRHADAGAACSRPSPRPGTPSATRSAPAPGASCSGWRAARCSSRATTRSTPTASSTPPSSGCAPATTARTAASAARPSSRPSDALEFLLRRGETYVADEHAAQDGRGRHVRPGRRRLRALLGRRALARPPLREDALRQRAARARVPARLAGDRRRAVPRR